MRMRALHREDRGENTIEYVAIVAIVSLMATLLMGADGGPDGPGDVGDRFEEEVCRVVQVEDCPPPDDGPGDGEGPGDEGPGDEGEEGGGPRDRWAEIPCIVSRDSSYRAWDVYLPRFIVVAGSATEGIEQVGPDRWRVTLTGEDRIGVGTFTGDPPGNRDSRSPWAPVTGPHGIGAITGGGRSATTYEFRSREEAERFLERRRGGWRGWAAAVTGVEGQMLDEVWHQAGNAWRRLTGQERPPDAEPEPRFYTFGLNGRAAGSAGFNGGRLGAIGGAGGATYDEALTLLNDPGNQLWIHSVSADAGVAGSLTPPQPIGFGRVPVPAVSAGGSLDWRVSYRYITDVEGRPRRLVLVYETTKGVNAQVGTGLRDNPRGDRYRGGGVSGSGRVTETVVHEAHLDLTVAENRAAFDRLFLTNGPLAHPRHIAALSNPLLAQQESPELAAAIAQLTGRLEVDGLYAQFRYEGMGGEAGAGFANFPGADRGGRRSMWGAFPSIGASSRDLEEATYMDNRQANPRYQPLRSCTESTSGTGITPNTGGSRPGSSGGPQGQP